MSVASRFHHDRRHMAVIKVFFDMYDGYVYRVVPEETDPLVRFHLICAQITEKCNQMHITDRLSLPNGMMVIPSYIPHMEDGHVAMIEVVFNLELHGQQLGRIKDVICAYDSFAIDLGFIIIGSGMPHDVYYQERRIPLIVEIRKMVDSVGRDVWPAWKGVHALRRGYKTPITDWSDDPLYTIEGIRRTVYQWSDIMGVDHKAVQKSLDEGYGIEDALKEAELIHKDKNIRKIPSKHVPYNKRLYCYEGR